ncbi:MAG: type II toxin-antitoxin system VapB family antitoxin [Chloroflexi bacterium]|nr:type II toxin-antitoxin system VapB family antitoxin [Chloroflexota bacterium]
MPTNLALDDELVREAQHLGGHRTKRAAVNAALDEYVRRRKQTRVFELFGAIEYEPDYDYKAERRRDSKRLP